jgi:hypothetical protein
MRTAAVEAEFGGSTTSEFELRNDLATAYRMFAHWGWDDLVFTHLSVRLPPGTLHAAPAAMRTFVGDQTRRDFAAATSLAWPAVQRRVRRLFPDTFDLEPVAVAGVGP